MLFVIMTFILFVLGAAVGSFLNVVVYRSIHDEQWVSGRSKCDFCSTPLSWFDNIPLISYVVLLRGKSRCCGQQLSISHPVVELLTGVLFVWWYWGGSLFFQLSQAPFQTIQPLFWLAVGVLLLLILFADVMYMIIPDIAVFPLMVLALAYRVVLTIFGVMQVGDFLTTIFFTAVVTLFFYALWFGTKGRGMGFGDVKLAVPMGLLLGWPNVLVGVFVSFVVGAVFGLSLIATGKSKFGRAIPFGPFMVIGIGTALLWGDQIAQWYLSLL